MKVRDFLNRQDKREEALKDSREALQQQIAQEQASRKRPSYVGPGARPTSVGSGWSPLVIVLLVVGGMGVVVVGGSMWLWSQLPAIGPYAGGGYGSQIQPGNAPTSVAITMAAAEGGRQVVDLTAVVVATNAPDAPKPPADFGPGHASRMSSAGLGISRTSYGSVIQTQYVDWIAPPVAHNGTAYFGGGFDSYEYHAVDIRTGKPKWSVNLSDNGPTIAGIENDTLVVNTESCTLFALDAETGAQRWSKWLGDPLASSPAVGHGIVISTYPVHGYPPVQLLDVPAGMRSTYHPTQALAAFDLKTGAVLWQAWVDGEAMNSPVITDRHVHVTTFSGTRYVFDSKTGECVQAHYDRATSRPFVDGDLVYYTARDDRDGKAREAVLCASITNAQPVRAMYSQDAPYILTQQAAQAQAHQADDYAEVVLPVLGSELAAETIGVGGLVEMMQFEGSRLNGKGNALYSSMGDKVICLDRQTGKLRWEYRLEHIGAPAGIWRASSPTLANGRLYVGTQDGELLALDPQTGAVTKRLSLGAPAPNSVAVSDGHACVATNRGAMMIVKLD